MRYNRLFTLCMLASLATGAFAQVSLSDVIGDSPLYGYFADETSKTAKWNKINPDGSVTTIWEDTNYSQSDIRMQSGWMKDGILCGFAQEFMGKYVRGFGYMERDVVTGDIYTQQMTRYSVVPKEKTFNSAVYQKSDNTIYGYGTSGKGMAFKKTAGNGDYVQSEDLFQLTDPYEWCPSLCIDQSTGQMYGITFGKSESLLLSIDEEGFSDVIATLPVKSSNATSAMAYFPATGYFLWSNYSNEGSGLYAIRLEDGSCEKVCELGADGNYSFFVTDRNADGDGIPAMPELTADGFVAPATSGFITYRLPEKDLAGKDLTVEELKWVALFDNDEYRKGSGAPGSTVSVEYSDIEDGTHTFGFYVVAGEMRSGCAEMKSYIGYDRPATPQNVVLALEGETRLVATWDAVTTGMNGGYVGLDDMKYNVYLNDNLVDITEATTWTGDIDPEEKLTANIVTVVAVSHGKESGSAASNSIVAGQPLDADVFFAPTPADASLMTYPSDEGLRWKYNTSFSPAVFSCSSKYGTEDPLNTWLIFPAINFPDVEATYKLEYQNGTYAEYDNEHYEIWMGREPIVDEMVYNILPRTQVGPTNSFAEPPAWNDVITEFNVPEPGVWYIGYKAASDAHKTGQVLLNIRLTTEDNVRVSEIDAEHGPRTVKCYYNAQGVRLAQRPAEGFYITVYSDGTSRKCMSRK